MVAGTCTNCGREANDLKRCKGACGGDDLYCNQSCQRQDWSLHKKICPRGEGDYAQSLTFVLPPQQFIISMARKEGVTTFGDIPVRAVRRMDEYGNSGLSILFSDHLGIEPLIPYAKIYLAGDSEEEVRENAMSMGSEEISHPYEHAVTRPFIQTS